MQDNKPRATAVLMGGIGNQLFQISAAMQLAKLQQISIDWSEYRNPRLVEKSEPEILRSGLSTQFVRSGTSKQSRIFGRLVQVVLRMENRESFSNPLNRIFVIPTINILLSFRYKRPSVLMHYKRIVQNKKGSILIHPVFIGYFQDFSLVKNDSVFIIKQYLFSDPPSNKLRTILEKYNNSKFIVLHFRFGDYLQESSFGIPHLEYFQNAAGQLLKKYPDLKFCAFSDEQPLAKRYYRQSSEDLIEWFPEKTLTAIEELQVMSLGTAFIISNSTFSWWAARFSSAESIDIIAPIPWFIKRDPSKKIIPLEWQKLPSKLIDVRMIS